MYIRNLDNLIEVLTAQDMNASQYQTELGATVQDLSDIKDALENAIYLRDAIIGYDADRATISQLRETWCNGLNQPMGVAPVFQVFTWPNPALPPGQITIANSRNRRFRNSPTITDEAAVANMLINPAPVPPDPATITPTLEKVSPAQANFMFSLIVGNRGLSDAYEVYTQSVEGNGPWVLAATVTTRSADVHWTPPVGTDTPQQIRVRVQLRRKNANYGLVSLAQTVTLNP